MAKSNERETPRCLAFLDEPFVGAADSHVTLAEIRSISEDGVKGTSHVYPAFVPTAKVTRTLRLKAAMGWRTEISDATADSRGFRIAAPSSERFEPLVYAWTSHNRTVLAPNPNWLASLGLVQSIRMSDEPRIEW